MTQRKLSGRKAPDFTSLKEEVAFWDTHSPLDYPGTWYESNDVVVAKRPLGHILGVRLDAGSINLIMEIGQSKAIGPSTLARMWIMERLGKPLPEATPYDEGLDFWDTHNPFSDQYQNIWPKHTDPKYQQPHEYMLGVRIDSATIKQMNEIARAKGVGPSTLARMWIMERLAELKDKEPKPAA